MEPEDIEEIKSILTEVVGELKTSPTTGEGAGDNTATSSAISMLRLNFPTEIFAEMNLTLRSMLSEITVLRKVTEGRIAFDPRMMSAEGKGAQYRNVSTGRLISYDAATAPGVGVFKVSERDVEPGEDATFATGAPRSPFAEMARQIADDFSSGFALSIASTIGGTGGGSPPPTPPVPPSSDREEGGEDGTPAPTPTKTATPTKTETEAGDTLVKNIDRLGSYLNRFASLIEKLTNGIRELQQTLGVSGGEAVELYATNIIESLRSTVQSLTGEVARVSAKEILQAQAAVRAEFGGVFSSEDARILAQQAKELGVTAEQLVTARRVFMTQTLGDTAEANRQQEAVLRAFEERGLTSRDAMDAISRYSDIVARNGIRFQQSFAEAAADAKKIDVDMSRINQVGDNIINGFEGFLESMAELGAMGFGFDATRLAEIAETGDTGALMNELRSQLAMTGKDLTDLRRSEQLTLSEAFGIPFEEMLRLAGETPELTEDRERNELLRRLLNMFEGVAGVIGLLGTANIFLAGIYTNTGGFAKSLGGLTQGFAGLTSTLGRIALGGAGVAVGTLGGAAIGTTLGATPEAALAGSTIGTLIGGGIGLLIGGPVGLAAGASIGGLAGGALSSYTADDIISRPGYGERTLITPQGPIALNNEDNVIAYADDLISNEINGIKMLSKGEITESVNAQVSNITVDMSALERKLDRVVDAIGSMRVSMNGNDVGQILTGNEQRAVVSGVYRAQRVDE